jgi:hypothetical protein
MVNNVLRNCGERSNLTGLSSLSGIQNVVFEKLTEALVEICSDQNTQWQFLESSGQVPLSTGNYQYQISGLTYGADMQREDRKSFRQEDSGNKLNFKTPQEWDAKWPNGIQSSMTGYPENYMKYAGYIVFDKNATSSENGKIVKFRYWRNPTLPDTTSPSATLDIPEPFDRILLVPLATMKVLAHLGNDEALVYKLQVYGDGRDIEGSLNQMKEIYGSPDLKIGVSLSAK